MTKVPFARIRPNHPTIAKHYTNQLALMRIAKRIESAGVHFDIAGAEKLRDQELRRIWRATLAVDNLLRLPDKQFQAFMGEKGVAVTKAAAKWFWETKKAPYLVHEKGTNRPQFNTALLVKYLSHDRTKDEVTGDVASYLLEIRAAFKTVSFLNNYLGFAYAGDGVIYGGFNPFGTVGERWSASASIVRNGHKFSLNYQNISSKNIKHKFRGRKIQLVQPLRQFFLPPPGCSWLCYDFDSQEARLLAIFTEDERFAWMIENKLKFHTQNAIDWFVPDIIPELPNTYDEFTKALNDESHPKHKKCKAAYEIAKAYMYAVAYQHVRGEVGQDKYPAILETCQKYEPKWTEEQVGQVVQKYFKMHPAIREKYQLAIRKQVLEHGYITHPLFGGRLYVEPPTVDPVTGHLKSSARGINQGQNYTFQSGGFHIYGKALITLEPQLDWESVGICMSLHDEIGAWCPIGEELKWGPLIKSAMEAPWEYNGKIYTLPADFHVGPNWGDAKNAPKVRAKAALFRNH